jgi:hypothetical protein
MLSSVSVRLRSLSQRKIAYRASGVAIAIGFISCVHILIGYDLRPRCGALPGAFAMYDGMFVVFWLGVIPHVLMLIFGSLTYINIKLSKKRIESESERHSIISHSNRRGSKTDKHLIIVSNRR